LPAVNLLIKPASSLCNMRCKYCFYADVSEHREIKSYGIMSSKTQGAMIKSALSYADYICNFSFQGGEPTLAGIEYFERHVALTKVFNIKNVKITNSIQTNGYIIDEKWAKFFGENNFLVGLSVDGPVEIHNTYRVDAQGKGTHNQLMKTIQLLKKYHVEFNILTVVTDLLANKAVRLMNFYEKNNLNYVQFIPCIDDFSTEFAKDKPFLSPEGYETFLKTTFDYYYRSFKSNRYISIRNLDNYVRMIQGYRPESCGMSGVCSCYFVIEADGSVYPCDFYVVDEFRLGDLMTNTFENMIHSRRAKKFINESKHIDDNCQKCKWYFLCRGGCKRYREPFVDSKPGLNKFCSSYKAFFEHSYERLREIAIITGKI
jgi:uncharacterized protein